ncbi:MAG: DEAD/DEAH box helicase family protein, partial [Thermoplasmata archaeon]|nr:DEAD/DEAH box helicase family protein [Thermoplasmata archaeon]
DRGSTLAPTAAPPPPPTPPTSAAMALILERTGVTLEQLREEALAQPGGGKAKEVPDTVEFRRIRDIPRRGLDSGVELAAALAAALTAALSTAGGQWSLRPIQALALHDIHQFGGLFGPIRVGGGKTLISYLAPAVLDARRPLLLVPAKLKEKTRREFRKLAQHWRGPHPDAYRIESYELLGRPQAGARFDAKGRITKPGLLERLAPDLIIMDEAHKVKNTRAAVTRRMKRYLEANPGTPVVAMSGTITKRSLRDYAHIAAWCMPLTCPVPRTHKDLEAWADCLDERVNPFRRVRPGALRQLANAEEEEAMDYGDESELSAVRQAYRRRLTESPGCVATQDGELGVSLSITGVFPTREDPQVEAQFNTLRTVWETPDGHPIADGIAMWRHARELGLGFFYRWNPRPPDDWLEARSLWAKFCRDVLKYNRRGLDSESQVAMAVDRGLYDDAGRLERWREIKPTFVPNTEAVWFSSEALETAEEWLAHHEGIVWVEHTEFGKELSKRTGLPFYSRKGQDPTGRVIEDHPPGKSLIASVQSNAEGRNLQAWNTNLVMSAPPNGAMWEQMMGRTHRDGQEAEEVTFHVYAGCFEQVSGLYQAKADSLYTQDTTGQAQKLTYADLDFPEPDRLPVGFRWNK